jgi:hypothetical protein
VKNSRPKLNTSGGAQNQFGNWQPLAERERSV